MIVNDCKLNGMWRLNIYRQRGCYKHVKFDLVSAVRRLIVAEFS
jgi:hypothetical protein